MACCVLHGVTGRPRDQQPRQCAWRTCRNHAVTDGGRGVGEPSGQQELKGARQLARGEVGRQSCERCGRACARRQAAAAAIELDGGGQSVSHDVGVLLRALSQRSGRGRTHVYGRQRGRGRAQQINSEQPCERAEPRPTSYNHAHLPACGEDRWLMRAGAKVGGREQPASSHSPWATSAGAASMARTGLRLNASRLFCIATRHCHAAPVHGSRPLRHTCVCFGQVAAGDPHERQHAIISRHGTVVDCRGVIQRLQRCAAYVLRPCHQALQTAVGASWLTCASSRQQGGGGKGGSGGCLPAAPQQSRAHRRRAWRSTACAAAAARGPCAQRAHTAME